MQVLTSNGMLRMCSLFLDLLSAYEPSPSSPRADDCPGGDAASLFMSNRWSQTQDEFSEITHLSNTLFDEVEQQYERLFSDLDHSAPLLLADSRKERLIYVLRCGMAMLRFLEFNIGLLVEKCNILLSILRRLCALNFKFPLYSCESTSGVDEFVLNRVDEVARRPILSFFCRVLEMSDKVTFLIATAGKLDLRVVVRRMLEMVYIEEFLMNSEVRKHFALTDKVSSTSPKLFVSHGSYGNMCAFQEIISNHFLLAASDELMFNRFINSLSWADEVENDVLVLSPSTALSFLGTCNMFIMPCILEAYLILWASKCIGIQRPKDNQGLNEELMNCYTSAFGHSVNVYADYISVLEFVGVTYAQPSGRSTKRQFDSCIQPMTCKRLRQQMGCLVNFCRMNSHGFLSEAKHDIASESISYIKENSQLLDDKFLDESLLILQYLILSILFEEETILDNVYEVHEEIYCCTAAIKLMSLCLLQIIWNLKQEGYADGTKALCEKFDCREYNYISNSISCFGNFDSDQFICRIMLDTIGKESARRASDMMFAHFASLLYYSFRRKIGFLWNNCIIMIMTILNLHIFEEGNLDVFMPLIVKSREMCEPKPPTKTPTIIPCGRPSSLIAKNMLRLKKLYLSKKDNREIQGESTSFPISMEDSGRPCSSTSEAEPSNGEHFLRILPGYEKNPSEWNDLVDFIECKPGKDYSTWLKNRKRFRVWQQGNREIRRRKRVAVTVEFD